MMLTGKMFRLKNSVLAIEPINGNRPDAVTLPSGAVIQVTSGPKETDERMVDIQWMDRHLVMFTIDIQERGEQLITNSN